MSNRAELDFEHRHAAAVARQRETLDPTTDYILELIDRDRDFTRAYLADTIAVGRARSRGVPASECGRVPSRGER
jgi:hypothetical protein